MASAYQKILKRIVDTEKRLKPTQHDISAILDFELTESTHYNYNEDNDVVEEYKNLKNNIANGVNNCYNLAYQPVKIKPRRWAKYDY